MSINFWSKVIEILFVEGNVFRKKILDWFLNIRKPSCGIDCFYDAVAVFAEHAYGYSLLAVLAVPQICKAELVLKSQML